MSARPRLFVLLLLICAALAAAPRGRAAPTDLLAPGGWHLLTPRPADAALEQTVADRDVPPLGLAVRVIVHTASDPPWRIQIVRDIATPVPEGNRVRLHFWAHSATANVVRASVERTAAPYDAVAARQITLTPGWRQYDVEGVSGGFALNAHFQAGYASGAVELVGIAVTDEGADPDRAAAQAALTPQAINARIERYRKGTLTVRVVDHGGRPVRGAAVTLNQTRHAFLFGCNVFGYDPVDTSAAQAAYRREYAALFNYATLPFYWGAFEGTRGRPDYARLQGVAEWCVAHGITPKGHPLVWHQVWPAWAPTAPDSAIPLLQARVQDLITRYRSTIHYWDVLNEANGAAGQAPPNGESEWIKRDGPAPVVEAALGWARTAGAGLPETFLYNDYDTGADNVALLTQLEKDGRLPDAVGLQSHMHSGVWPPLKTWETCQTFARFGRPIHFTEITVLSGPERDMDMNGPPLTDWNTTPAGEAAQADYAERFYTLLFSHPSLRAITWWDFSDRNAWLGAPAGLVRRDMSPKPVYVRLLGLIRHRWWTSDAARTDAGGTLTRRVFYGDYALSVTDARGHAVRRTVTFPEAAPPMEVTVRLP